MLALMRKTDPANLARDLHVNMSNTLVRAAQGLLLSEKRVVSLCMSRIDSVRLDSGRFKFRITAQEFAEQFDIDLNTAYEQLIACGRSLLKKTVKIVVNPAKGQIKEFSWLSFIEYQKGDGWIELGFNQEMTPHIVMLREKFTSYKLKQASSLRSLYSWRLLELMTQYKSTGLLRISTDDFCVALEVPPSCTKDFGQLKRRVIDSAIKELEEKDHWEIEFNHSKNGGRKITTLEFRFRRNPQQELEL